MGVDVYPGMAMHVEVRMHTPVPTLGTVHGVSPLPVSAVDPPPSTTSLPNSASTFSAYAIRVD